MMASLSKEDPTEERFPLLLLLLEDSPGREPPETSRLRSVARGAATLLARWPWHVVSVVLIALVVAVVSLITLLVMAVASSLMAGSHAGQQRHWFASTHAPFSLHPLGASCQDNFTSPYNHPLHPKVVDFLQPAPPNNTTVPSANISMTYQNSLYTHETKSDRTFFVYMEEDDLESQHACAIESSARLNPNISCYVIIVSRSSPTTELLAPDVKNKNLSALAEEYSNIQLLNINGDSYFASSPLHEVWRRATEMSPVIRFAARVITLWQYGGTNYDLDLVTLQQPAEHSLPDNDDTMVAELKYGLILSVKQQCHAFLYDLMKVLESMAYHFNNEKQLPVGKVMAQTLVQFCSNGKVTFQDSSIAVNYTCPGVKEVPQDFLCRQYPEHGKCLWTSALLSRNSSLYKHVCPVSYRIL